MQLAPLMLALALDSSPAVLFLSDLKILFFWEDGACWFCYPLSFCLLVGT
jgi:hypothetical protein